jgi:hypothetical protein
VRWNFTAACIALLLAQVEPCSIQFFRNPAHMAFAAPHQIGQPLLTNHHPVAVPAPVVHHNEKGMEFRMPHCDGGMVQNAVTLANAVLHGHS